MKPCDNCQQNILEVILYEEITCYLKCERYKKWVMENDKA